MTDENPIEDMIIYCDITENRLKDVITLGQFMQVKATLLLARETKRIADILENKEIAVDVGAALV